MRPEIALLVLFSISCFFFCPTASYCVPRTSPYAVPVNYSSYSSSSPTSAFSLPPISSPPYSAPNASPLLSPPCESSPPASAPAPPTALSPQSAGPDVGLSLGLVDGVVIAICGHTSHPDLCVSSIRPLLPSSGSLDAMALLKLEIQAIRTNLEPAKSAASKFFAGTKKGEPLYSIMETCIYQYDDVPDTLDNALKALEEGDKGTLNSMLGGVLSDFETCEQGFEEFEMESLMAIYDEMLIQLSSNCLAISELI